LEPPCEILNTPLIMSITFTGHRGLLTTDYVPRHNAIINRNISIIEQIS